jgi:SAM-dependent methyltransferase
MSKLISDEYKEQLAQLHREKEDFGTSSPMYADSIKYMLSKFKCEDMLDFGCGKAALKKALGIKEGYYGFDPAIPEYSDVPNPRDLVVCTDVLEHVELGMVPNVIKELARVTKKVGYFVIHTGPALNVLPDGRNAHITQEPARWWLLRLCKHFNIEFVQRMTNGVLVIVTPLNVAVTPIKD